VLLYYDVNVTRTVDLNADAGEAFGHWRVADEDALFPQLSSVNLACGFHAGDPLTMQQAVKRAKHFGVAVGAHPGFPDLVGFGRRDLAASPEEIYADVLYQLGALAAFLRAEGMTLHHVKAHGALYFKMMREPETARAVAEAVATFGAAFDAAPPLVVLAGEGGQTMQIQAAALGLRVVTEAFPDRAYLSDGRLAPRTVEGALLSDPDSVAERAVMMATGTPLDALDGGSVVLEADTLCLHGDHPQAAQNAQAVRRALAEAGIDVCAF